MRRSEQGMGLVELMVSIGILGIIVGTATTYFAESNKTSKVEYLKEQQVKIGREIESALANPDAIKNSMFFPGNEGLKQCIEPGSTCGAALTEPPGKLFTLRDTQQASESLAGPTLGLDLDGKTCTIGASGCVFNPIVSFWATCELNASDIPEQTCTKAGFLNFKYEVKVVHTELQKRMSSYPEKDNATNGSLKNIVRVRIADLLVRTDSPCPNKDEMMMGVDAQGKPICECIVQKTVMVGKTMKPVFNGNKRVCGEQICPKDTIMTGYEEDVQTINGKQVKTIVPRCRGESECSVSSPPADCPCKIITLDSATNSDCGAGFWMVSMDYGVCQATTEKGGKGAPETVKCSSKTARCCSFEQQ
jgi:hypothetical protein